MTGGRKEPNMVRLLPYSCRDFWYGGRNESGRGAERQEQETTSINRAAENSKIITSFAFLAERYARFFIVKTRKNNLRLISVKFAKSVPKKHSEDLAEL